MKSSTLIQLSILSTRLDVQDCLHLRLETIDTSLTLLEAKVFYYKNLLFQIIK